jgi:hypothetical protein
MAINKLTQEIIARKEKLYKMLEQNSNIQTEDIIEFSQELDQLIKNYYVLTGFCSEEKVKYKNLR